MTQNYWKLYKCLPTQFNLQTMIAVIGADTEQEAKELANDLLSIKTVTAIPCMTPDPRIFAFKAGVKFIEEWV